eukprot:gene31620-38213_t
MFTQRLSETVLSFKNVTFEYSPLKPILSNATFNVEEGRKVTIMGQNGSGKSTLLKLINGKLNPQKGSINLKKGFAVSTALQVITPDDRKRTVLEFFTHHLHGTVSGIDGRIAAALQKAYAGNYLFVKEEIAKRIARENAENARLHKEAQQKKEQANVFAHKGGSMRKAAKKLKAQAVEMQAAKVVVRKEDRELRDFSIPFQTGGVLALPNTTASSAEAAEGIYSSQYNPLAQSVGSRLLTLRRISFPAYIAKPAIDLTHSPVLFEHGTHVRIKGGNGSGKSTFLDALAHGRVAEADATVKSAARIGYY